MVFSIVIHTWQIKKSWKVVRERSVGVSHGGGVVVVYGLLLGPRLALRVTRSGV